MNPQQRIDSFYENFVLPDVDYDQWFSAEEKAKIKDANYFKEQVKNLQLNPDSERGLRLPFNKTNDFRIRSGESTIHTGYNGHRKSMMLGYIQLGLIAQGEKCLTVSLEMQPKRTLDRQLKQFAGNDEPTLPIHDQFFNFVKGQLFIYDQLGTVNWKRVIGVCRYAINELGVTQCFLDSLMKFGIKKKDLETQAEFVDEMTTLGKDTGAHMHLVAHANKPMEGREDKPPSKYDVSGNADLTNMVDNVLIHHKVNEEKVKDNGFNQYMFTGKQRNPEGEDSEPVYGFCFQSNSLQFKSFKTAQRMDIDDWLNGRFI